MTGLVSIPPPNAPCSGEESCEDLVHADGWFAAIDLDQIKSAMRVGTDVPRPRLREAVLKGMTDAFKDLSAWRFARVMEGIEHLSQVPAPELDGENICVHFWRTAVYNYALAQLSETHRDVSATGSGEDRAETRALSADDYRRDALHAVRDLLGIMPEGMGGSRITAELI